MEGKIQVYTGDGKGKTTAAFGLCMRAWGQGLRAYIVQFQKAQLCGEHMAAQRLGIEVTQCPMGRAMKCQGHCPLLDVAEAKMKSALDVLLLDEIMAAIKKGCVALSDVLSILEKKPATLEIILTGRNAPSEIIEKADLVTQMQPIKHYYKTGLKARKGIEY